MPSYRVFGGVLASQVPFPDLPEANTERPDWRLTLPQEPAGKLGEAIGEDQVFGDTKVRSFGRANGLSLVYDDTGRFDLSADGTISWYLPSIVGEQLLEGGRADVLGRALAAVFHLQGAPSLHASAVAIGQQGIAFMGPKGFGKSTIAAALARRGAVVLTDDTLPVVRGPEHRLRPGVTRIRLLRDSAQAVHVPGADEATPERKVIVSNVSEATALTTFSAAYLLSPAMAEKGRPDVERERLPAPLATMALIEQGKLAGLLRGTEAAAHFQQVADVASSIPVYRLRIKRDLGRLEHVVEQLMAWHGAATAGAS